MNFEEKIREIFENDKLIFNKEFNKYFINLKEDMKRNLFEWCKKVKNGEIEHIPLASKKHRNFILFIDKIADKRLLVARIKNSDYIEIHLSDHKYYDEQRRRFGIKKGSKEY